MRESPIYFDGKDSMVDHSIGFFQRVRMNNVARDLEDTVPDWKLSYRIDEAVAATGIGRTKLYEIIKAGKLETRRADGMILILRDELQRYLHSLPSTRSR